MLNKKIMDLCLKYISYDPNYNYDDEEDNESDENAMEQDENDTDEKFIFLIIF